jgi:hypothetical protein
MNIEIISSRSQVESPGPKCKGCEDPPHTAFNWRYARENSDHALHSLSELLKQVRSLKFGHLFACRLCGSNWVLDDDHCVMTSEIRLSAEPFSINEPVHIAEADSTLATYFFADWFAGAEDLNKAHPMNQPYAKLRAFWKRLFLIEALEFFTFPPLDR